MIRTTFRKILPAPLWQMLRNSRAFVLNFYWDRIFFFLNRKVGFKGINIGSGKWYKWGWASLDARHFPQMDAVLNDKTKLPFADSSIDFVFSSHFFEHISDEVAENLLGEAHRVLKPGGFCRISVPNLEQAIEKYNAKDHFYFDEILAMKARYENWLERGVEVTLETKVLYQFASYDNMSDRGLFPAWKLIPGYYCGPPMISSHEIRRAMEGRNALEFSKWAVSQVPKDRLIPSMGHVNVYNTEKFEKLFSKAGFKIFYRSVYRRSKALEMTGPQFDNRPEQSLYFEGIK